MLNVRGVAVTTLLLSFVTQPVSAQEPGPKLSKAATGRHSMVGIVTPADEGSTFQYVDLGPKGNQALAQDIGPEGNHLKEVPQGEHDFAGTKFKVGEKMVHVGAVSKPELPEKVEGIKVDARFDTLHILQSTEFGEMPDEVEDGTAIGAYVVHYADKTSETIPIVYGECVRDWWDWKDRNELKRAKVAWRGKNNYSAENDREIRLFSEAWTNPHPDKLVTTIDVVSKKTACAPFVVALTLETKRKAVPPRGPAQTTNDSRAAAIDERVHAEMQKRRIPGLSLAILDSGKIVKATGYGVTSPVARVLHYRQETDDGVRCLLIHMTADGLLTDYDIVDD